VAVTQDDVDVRSVFLYDVKAVNLQREVIGVLGWYRINRHDVHDRIFLILGGEVEELLLEVRAHLFDLEMGIVECDDFVDECLIAYHSTEFFIILLTLFCVAVISVSDTTAVTVMFCPCSMDCGAPALLAALP